ncbi:hypothetical protein [Streptomyces globisporus]|uniref:hypothetical protein n=1 Tax=Streptomyces globisporus TaxID=1908 RepID=UPI0004C67669|nr:hypothetical protein [Streptomyces globisporus]
MSQPPRLGPLAPVAKKKFFDGLSPWQKALAALPLALLFVGGAIGGALGALGAFANVRIARTQLPAPLKAAAMLGVALAAAVVLFAVAGLLSQALNG